MTITLYNCANDNKTLTKTLTSYVSLPCSLYDTSSVIDPRIRVEWFAGIAAYNYAYIADFGRYYFIKDIQADPGGAAIIDCNVDVLMSFNAAIRATPAVVVRQSRKNQQGANRGTWINDPRLPISTGRVVRAVEFEGTNLNIDSAAMTSTNFVLNVAGGGAIT